MNKRGLAQIPLMIGLLIMAIAVPVATKLVQENQENRGSAATYACYCPVSSCAIGSCWWGTSGPYQCPNTSCPGSAPTATKIPTKPPTTATKAPATATKVPTKIPTITLGGLRPADSACLVDSHCLSGKCTYDFCEKLGIGRQCLVNSSCASGACVGFKCVAGNLPGDAVCTNNVQCTSGWCTFGRCQPFALGRQCNMNNQCQSGSCANGVCVTAGLQGGQVCTENAQCLTNECTFGHCEKLLIGQKCTLDNHCASGSCRRPGGSACWLMSDCTCVSSGTVPTATKTITPTKPQATPTGLQCSGGQIRCVLNGTKYEEQGCYYGYWITSRTCTYGCEGIGVGYGCSVTACTSGEKRCREISGRWYSEVCTSTGSWMGTPCNVGAGCVAGVCLSTTATKTPTKPPATATKIPTKIPTTGPLTPTVKVPTSTPGVHTCPTGQNYLDECFGTVGGGCGKFGCSSTQSRDVRCCYHGVCVSPDDAYVCQGGGVWENVTSCQDDASCNTVPPTSIPTNIPTTEPQMCTECPGVFNCYTNGNEYRWFVVGYVMDGFEQVEQTQCNDAKVVKPIFLGKSKGDANCDGYIDVIDFSLWGKEHADGNYGELVSRSWSADFTGPYGVCDGKVDIYDFSLWQKYFNELGGGQ